jgi:hypothetical protein
MPLPLLAAVVPAIGSVVGKKTGVGKFVRGLFKKKEGGTVVGNLIRGIFNKKSSGATATPPLVLKSAKFTTDEAGGTSNTKTSSGVMAWIKENTLLFFGGALLLLFLFGKKLFK